LAIFLSTASFLNDIPYLSSVFTRLAAGILAGASLAALAAPAEAGTSRPVRWNTGGAVWTTTSSEFKTFFETGEVTDRALDAGINNSGWTAEEIQEGMTKGYSVDIIGVSRFLYSDDGVKFLKDQTASYFPYWRMKKTACGGSSFRDHRRLHRRRDLFRQHHGCSARRLPSG
jgi:hypothetical protein